MVKVWGTPTASIATSTPAPSVSASTCFFQSLSPELTVSVAPEVVSPLESGFVQVDRDDLGGTVQARRHHRGQSDRT